MLAEFRAAAQKEAQTELGFTSRTGLEDFRNVFGPRLDYGKIRAIL